MRGLPLVESKDTINADGRQLQLHADTTKDEKLRAIEEFARNVVLIKEYDVFLFAVW
jgi:hypothetical protein